MLSLRPSRCPRSDCNGSGFELKELEVRGAKWKYLAVQCSTCGAVVALQDFVNVGQTLGMIEKKLDAIAKKLS